jgi:hypothetical protein
MRRPSRLRRLFAGLGALNGPGALKMRLLRCAAGFERSHDLQVVLSGSLFGEMVEEEHA